MIEALSHITPYIAQATNDVSDSGWNTIGEFVTIIVNVIEEVLFTFIDFFARFIASSDPLTVVLLFVCTVATLKMVVRGRRMRFEAMQKRNQPKQVQN